MQSDVIKKKIKKWPQFLFQGPEACSYVITEGICYKFIEINFGVGCTCPTYLQLPLRQWGAGNVYILVLSSWKVTIAENPIAVMEL